MARYLINYNYTLAVQPTSFIFLFLFFLCAIFYYHNRMPISAKDTITRRRQLSLSGNSRDYERSLYYRCHREWDSSAYRLTSTLDYQ